MNERRKRRSNVPELALRFYLESVAEENQLHALALANSRGTLVAGTGSRLPELAALARAGARGEGTDSFEEVTGGEDLYTRAMTIDEKTFYLASVGGPVRHVAHTERALRRLMSL